MTDNAFRMVPEELRPVVAQAILNLALGHAITTGSENCSTDIIARAAETNDDYDLWLMEREPCAPRQE